MTTESVTISDFMISTSYGSGENDSMKEYSLAVQIVVGCLIVICGLCNIVGNSCTLAAFARDRTLRTPHNCYIANLAVTDLAVGIFSVPLYAVYTIRRHYWQFGYVFCKVWGVMDFWICAESVLTIVLISHDRFLLVKDGAIYNQKHTRQGAVVKIALSWVLAFLLYGPAIIGFNHWRGYSTVEEGDCDTEFGSDFWYTLIAAIVEFLVPVVLLLVFNVYIFWKIRQRAFEKLQREQKTKKVGGISTGTGQDPGITNQAFTPSPSMEALHTDKEKGQGHKQEMPDNGYVVSPNDVRADVPVRQSNGGPKEHKSRPGTDTVPSCVGTTPERKSSSMAELNMRRYKKAARSLALLIIVFTVCWVPYTVSTLILTVCKTCIHEDLYGVFNWLLWLNSSLNPFLYAVMNPLFRRHYRQLLCGWHTCGQQKNKFTKERDGSGASVHNPRP